MKKIDPTKNVPATTAGSSASKYSGTDPRAKQSDPIANRLADPPAHRAGAPALGPDAGEPQPETLAVPPRAPLDLAAVRARRAPRA